MESFRLMYGTNPQAIVALLPNVFKPGKEPIVSVLFADNNGVDFTAGSSYRIVSKSLLQNSMILRNEKDGRVW